jgi:hypothetical protein
MYKCKNKMQIGDCVSIEVDIDVQEMFVKIGTIGIVLDVDFSWGNTSWPLLTIKFASDEIQQIPASWCILCSRK